MNAYQERIDNDGEITPELYKKMQDVQAELKKLKGEPAVKPEPLVEQKPEQKPQDAETQALTEDLRMDAYKARDERVKSNPAKKVLYDFFTEKITEVRKKIAQITSKYKLSEGDLDENDIILRAADKFDPTQDQGNYRGYIYRIAENHAKNIKRLKKNQAKCVEGETAEGEASSCSA